MGGVDIDWRRYRVSGCMDFMGKVSYDEKNPIQVANVQIEEEAIGRDGFESIGLLNLSVEQEERRNRELGRSNIIHDSNSEFQKENK